MKKADGITFNIASITTFDHLDQTLAMYKSIKRLCKTDCRLHCLIVDHNDWGGDRDLSHLSQDVNTIVSDVVLYQPNDLFKADLAVVTKIIAAKYAPENQVKTKVRDKRSKIIVGDYDYLRWSLKASFVDYLLDTSEYVIYCDNDLYFYDSPEDYFSHLNRYSMSLTPHWRTIELDAMGEYLFNFKHGLYNGGFFTANKHAKPILHWWAKMCSVCCSVEPDATVYVDQQYLDVVPIYFDNVHIIKHKGMNVAAWNYSYLPRKSNQDGKVTIDGDPIIFVHYSPITQDYIERGVDLLLTEHLNIFKHARKSVKSELIRMGHYKVDPHFIL